MTMLYSSQGTITFPIAAGNTLVVNNLSGVETVTGSTVAREDVSTSFGAGRYGYGPQTSDATITLTTTGQCDYEIRVGDVTPSNDIAKADPVTGGLDATARRYAAYAGLTPGVTYPNDVMLLIGDSLIDRGFTTSDVTRASCWAHIANCMAGAPFYPVNGGVSGQTTEQILARVPGLISTYKPALIILGPNSVNDLSNTFTSARTIAALTSMFNQCLASGALVVVQTVHDGTLASPLSTAASNYQRKWYKDVNAFIRSYAASKAVILHDFAAIYNEPTTGGAKSGFDQNGDGRHLSFRGSYYVSKSLYDRVFSKLPARLLRNPHRFDPRNLLAPFGACVGNNATGTNGFLLGTGATGTGPNAWQYRRDVGDAVSTIDGTAGTTANADKAIGGNKATVTVTAGGDGKGGGIAIPQNGATKRFTNAWASGTAYTYGDRISIDSTRAATVFTPGTSAGTAPDFTGLVAGDTLVDNGVTWMVTDRPKPGDKLRVLCDFDATLVSGTGGVFLSINVTDSAGTTTLATLCNSTTGSDFTAYGPYPDFSPYTSRTTFRHEFTLPSNIAAVGELSLRLFFVGANGAQCTINCYGASVEIIS